MKIRTLSATILIGLGAISAFAQSTADIVQRDVNQQTRIENGLKDGSLNTKEAGRLEKEQSQVDRLQAKDLKNGKLTPMERAQLRKAQDKASRDIHAAKTNDVKGNPASESSERMQADVQRNVNQETRAEQGVKSGTLTNHEAAKLESGQAWIDRKEARATKNGRVNKAEQAGIQQAESKQSEDIFEKKHNAHTKK
jgi:hypothetical protein